MTPALPASPTDLSAILTSLGVFSLAIAAVVGGIYKGIKEVKQGGVETGTEVRSAMILETATAAELTRSNSQLSESMRSADHRIGLLLEALADLRTMTRSQIEEQHRLRAATVDLVDQMRRR